MIRRLLPILGLLIAALSTMAAGDQKPKYVYLWSPRNTDVGPKGTKENTVLKALLFLCPTKQYSPDAAEGIDFIIRKQFLLSATPFPHAYTLYLSRIRELNPGRFKNGTIQRGEIIILPSGPKFEASELNDVVSNPSVINQSFMAMSQSAYKVHRNINEHVKEHAVSTLKYYVSATGGGTSDELFKAIRNRGLLYAITSKEKGAPISSPLEPIALVAADNQGQSQLDLIKQNDPSRALPAQIVQPPGQSRNCSGGCTNCQAWLTIPSNVNFSNVKVLVVDTGISSGYISSDHIIPTSDNQTGLDVSPQAHGTFVYSEIAAAPSNSASPQRVFGVIPQNDIYVSGAATKQGVSVIFDTSEIVKAWNTFNVQMASLSGLAQTRIVNLSVFGGEVLSTDSSTPMSPPIPRGMLIVAAAGNEGTGEDAKLHAFARYSNGNVPIIVVGALGIDGKPAQYSDWSTEYVQLFAPGDCVCGGPDQIDGTSQATPFVTVAAASLAASHPEWTPMWVMWRLLSTADHPDFLQTKALAGKVNLARALAAGIYVEEKQADGTVKAHVASAIRYDAVWKNAFTQSGSNTHNNETLRLYPNGTVRSNGAVCFTTLNFYSYATLPTCVAPNAQIQLSENGVQTPPIAASQINDLILPMPPVTGAEPNLPDVILSSLNQ